MSPPPFTQSIWRRPEGWRSPHQPVLPGESVDLVVIGAGFLGLSTALRAARQGMSVRVLERGTIGSGASGLNGGQVIPGLKHDPEWLEERFGPRQGQRIVDFVSSTADHVFDLIQREDLDVPFRRCGWIQAAHTEAALAMLRERDRQWRARGADVRMLSAEEVHTETGAQGYLGGWWDRRAGAIDPLAFVCELARLASEAGAALAENTEVRRLRRDGNDWILESAAGGILRAKRVLVATNAYSHGLIPGLEQSLVTLHSFQVATAPLPEPIAQTVLPGEQPVSDSRRILVYYRKTAEGRLILGGRGRMSCPRSKADWAHLEHAIGRLYPALQHPVIEARWFGRVGMTPDYLPHIHEPEPGLLAVVGCQGRGIGLMAGLGGRLVDYLISADPEALPFSITPIRPIRLHAFRRIGVGAAITWYRVHDAWAR